MAIITYGQIVTEARGSISGTVFTRGHYGPFARARVSPVQPGTPSQADIGAAFGAAALAWQANPEAWRKSWDVLARELSRTNSLGHTYNTTGQNLFISVMMNRHMTGAAVTIDQAPNLPEPSPQWGDILLDVDTTADTITLDWSNWQSQDGHALISLSHALSPGVTYVKRSWLKFVFHSICTVNDWPLDITAAWEALYGPFAAVPDGYKIACRVQFLSTGYLHNGLTKALSIAHS